MSKSVATELCPDCFGKGLEGQDDRPGLLLDPERGTDQCRRCGGSGRVPKIDPLLDTPYRRGSLAAAAEDHDVASVSESGTSTGDRGMTQRTRTSPTVQPRLEARSRWSSAAKCGRQGAYGLLGVDPIEPDDRTRRLWYRGRQLGAYVADSFAEKHGEHNIIREKAIPWPAGVLHQDVYIIPDRVAVEVKSTSTPASILDAALMQLAGEVHFDPDADGGLLVLVNPSDLAMEFVPFRLTDEWVERVEILADEVMRAGASNGQVLPDRVCHKPGDGVGRFCPFISTCFEGWASPPAEEISSIEVVELARQWVEAKQDYRRHKADEETAHDRYKEIEVALSDYLEPGRVYQIGPYQARRIVAKGRETFQLARARKAGQFMRLDEERFAPFLTVGAPSERYDIQVEGAGDVTVDFGDEAPF